MRIVSRLCHICHAWHNHFSCPYCGAIKIGVKHYDRLTGRELVRAKGLPTLLSERVLPVTTTSVELEERIVPRLIARAR
jgi:hypothetical protein